MTQFYMSILEHNGTQLGMIGAQWRKFWSIAQKHNRQFQKHNKLDMMKKTSSLIEDKRKDKVQRAYTHQNPKRNIPLVSLRDESILLFSTYFLSSNSFIFHLLCSIFCSSLQILLSISLTISKCKATISP